MNQFPVILFLLHRGYLVTCPSGHSALSLTSSLADDPTEVDSGRPAFKLRHLSSHAPRQSQVLHLSTWLEQALQSVTYFGMAESTASYLLISLNMGILIRCLIWSWGTSLCFNNTCDKIYLFAFKVVNYGAHFK